MIDLLLYINALIAVGMAIAVCGEEEGIVLFFGIVFSTFVLFCIWPLFLARNLTSKLLK